MAASSTEEHPAPTLSPNVADDDRDAISSGDPVILIVENDLAFAAVLLDAARQAGFKGLVSNTGAGALALMQEFLPSAVTLDISLPDMRGWRVLDRLKADPSMRHVPTCVVSTDDSRERALQAGAIGFLAKPLQSKDAVDAATAELYRYCMRPQKKLLVALPDSPWRAEFLRLVDGPLHVTLAEEAASLADALADADGLVIDEAAGTLGPQDLLEVNEARSGVCQLPVILHANSPARDSPWRRPHRAFAVHVADTLQAAIAHTAFLLHRSPAALSDAEREALAAVYDAPQALRGKKALIVDDDMRNIFALATVLDNEGMLIVSADNGREAIRLVETDPDIDIVLMDIMMPEMDGIETMQQIRRLPRGRDLPMIAVTAKAMKGDRQKCIEAGAWDYLSKPVDPKGLLEVLRGWLCH